MCAGARYIVGTRQRRETALKRIKTGICKRINHYGPVPSFFRDPGKSRPGRRTEPVATRRFRPPPPDTSPEPLLTHPDDDLPTPPGRADPPSTATFLSFIFFTGKNRVLRTESVKRGWRLGRQSWSVVTPSLTRGFVRIRIERRNPEKNTRVEFLFFPPEIRVVEVRRSEQKARADFVKRVFSRYFIFLFYFLFSCFVYSSLYAPRKTILITCRFFFMRVK